MDERWHKTLYVTTAINNEGLEGHTYIPGEINLKTSSPMNANPGTNPEQLLGMSLATCLKATLYAIESEHNVPHSSQVHVNVAFVGTSPNFEFLIEAQIKMPKIDQEIAQKLVEEAEIRCPVSKLLNGNETYTIQLVTEFNIPD